MCRTEGCFHRTVRGATDKHHVGISWLKHQICSCCAIELVYLGTISGPFRPSSMCNRRNDRESK